MTSGVTSVPPRTKSRTAPCPIEGTRLVAGRVASRASRYWANVDQCHSAGPSPSSPRRYARRASTPSAATGAGREPVGVDQLRREPLAELGGDQRIGEGLERGVRVHVDEAGAEHQPGGLDRGCVDMAEIGLDGCDPALSTPTSRSAGGPSPGYTVASRITKSIATSAVCGHCCWIFTQPRVATDPDASSSTQLSPVAGIPSSVRRRNGPGARGRSEHTLELTNCAAGRLVGGSRIDRRSGVD